MDVELPNLVDIDLYGLSQLNSQCISRMIEANISNLRTLQLQECMFEENGCILSFSTVSELPFLTV